MRAQHGFFGVLLLLGATACSFGSAASSRGTPSAPAVAVVPIPPAVQPGGLIAFRRFTDNSLRTSQIVTAHPDGSEQRNLTEPAAGVQETLPSWSPDGKQVAYMRITSSPNSAAEVYVVGWKGGPERQLTHSPAGSSCAGSSGPGPANPTASLSCNGDPSWSPSGAVIAYSHTYERDSVSLSEIWLVNQDGSGAHALTADGQAVQGSGPAWSPDGKQLAFQRSSDNGTSSIYVVNSDGSRERRLTGPGGSFGDHPAWAPDGSTLLFRSNPGDPTQDFGPSDLYTVRTDGSALTNLTRAGRNLEFLSSSWSPDGRWLITSRVQSDSHGGQAQLYLLNPSASQGRLLLEDPRWQSAPRWAPSSATTNGS